MNVRTLSLATLSLIPSLTFAAASEGLKWDAVNTYDVSNGTKAPLNSGEEVVYLILNAVDGKQVASVRKATSIAASALPADGCYVVKAAIYDPTKNSYLPNEISLPTASYCTKPAPPPSLTKRLSTPTGLTGTAPQPIDKKIGAANRTLPHE